MRRRVQCMLLAVALGWSVAPARAATAVRTPARIGAGEADRFVRIWAPRIADTAAFERFLAHDGLPRSVRDEGFHALDERTRRTLTSRLVEHLVATRPDFAQQWGGYTAEGRVEFVDVLHAFIFEKERLKGALRRPEPRAAGRPMQSELDARIEVLRTTVVPGPPSARTPGVSRPDLQTIAAARATAPVPNPGLGGTALRWPGEIPLIYRLCAEPAGTCTTQAFGVPALLDVTGDAVPDVSASLSSASGDVLANPTGARFIFDAQRIDSNVPDGVRVQRPPLRQHLYVYFDVYRFPLRLQFGFDGRNGSLADRTSLGFTLKDALAPILTRGRKAGAIVELQQVNPGPDWALTFGIANIDRTTEPPVVGDPFSVALAFRPPEASYRGEVDFERVVDDALGTDDLHVDYNATPIASLTATSLQRNGDLFGLEVAGVPSHADIDVDLAGDVVEWHADGPVGLVRAFAELTHQGRLIELDAGVRGIPDDWRLAYPSGELSFTATGADPVSEVFARVTNHGRYRNVPRDADARSFATVTYSEEGVVLGGGGLPVPTGNGDVDATVSLKDIRSVAYRKTDGGMEVELEAGDGKPLTVIGDFSLLPHAVARLDATVARVPDRITLTQDGGTFSYDASDHLDLDVELAAGNPAGIADAPGLRGDLHGLVARDGYGCVEDTIPAVCGTGATARFRLLGAPRGLSVDGRAGTFTLTDFAPPAGENTFAVDIAAEHVLDSPVNCVSQPCFLPKASLWIAQEGIPSSGIDMAFGPFRTVDGSPKIIHLDVYRITHTGTANLAELGRFTVSLQVFADDPNRVQRLLDLQGSLTISNVPGEVDVFAVFGEDEKRIEVTLQPHGVDSIKILLGTINTNGCPSNGLPCPVKAGIELTDVPAELQLTFGREASSDGFKPMFRYVSYPTTVPAPGDDPNGLDVTAFVDASLFTGGLAARAAARFLAGDLGRDTKITLGPGANVNVSSSPVSGVFELRVWGTLSLVHSLGQTCWPACHTRFHAEIDGGPSGDTRLDATVGGGLEIDDLGFRLTEVRTWTLKPGITSAVEGNYGTFGFGWKRIDVSAFADVEVTGVGDFGVLGKARVTFIRIHPRIALDVNVEFHVARNVEATAFKVWTPRPCISPAGWAYIDIVTRPDLVFTRFNDFTVSGSSGPWLITPDPGNLFGWAPDIVATFASPYGGGIGAADGGCH